MTEYELQAQEVLTATSLASMETFGYYLTILASYLVVAYMAGNKLTTSQAFTISILFIFGAMTTAYTSYAYLSRAVELADVLESLNPDRTYGAQPFSRNLIVALQFLGVLACLRFMWDVRHPKAE